MLGFSQHAGYAPVMVSDIGGRVRDSIPAHLSQRRLAPEIGMTHDALSRAINGQRQHQQ